MKQSAMLVVEIERDDNRPERCSGQCSFYDDRHTKSDNIAKCRLFKKFLSWNAGEDMSKENPKRCKECIDTFPTLIAR